MAWEWLAPILTPTALAAVQHDATVLGILLGVLLGIIGLCALTWYISFRTGKDNGTYVPPKLPAWLGGSKAKAKGEGWRKMGGK